MSLRFLVTSLTTVGVFIAFSASASDYACPDGSKYKVTDSTGQKEQWCETPDGKYVGNYTESYDGQIQSVVPYINGKKQGIGKELIHSNSGPSKDYEAKYFYNDREVNKMDYTEAINPTPVKPKAAEKVEADKSEKIKVGLTPWPNAGEVVKVQGEVGGGGHFSHLEPELSDLPLYWVAIDTGLNGKWVIHVTPEQQKKYFKVGTSAKVSCVARSVRTYKDGSKAIHCQFKEIMVRGQNELND